MSNPRQFWAHQKPILENMFLNKQALEIDERERPEIFSYLPNYKGARILDLGAGIGRFTKDFASLASFVAAVDLNQAFLEENRRKNKGLKNIKFILSDVMDLSFEERSFDLIFASGIFLYLEDTELESLAKKLYDWLENGGHLFFRESLSPFDYPHQSTHAILRPFSYYQELFSSSFKLVNLGSLKSHIELFGDPFRCFWLFRKDSVKT